MRITNHPAAQAELIEAAQFYERRDQGLGDTFLGYIGAMVEAVGEDPWRWRAARGARTCQGRRFPYAIIYRIKTDFVEVLAYKHHKRHPDYWRDRLID